MRERIHRPRRVAPLGRWTPALLISLAWLCVIAMAMPKLRQSDRLAVALAGVGATAITSLIVWWSDRARWREPIRSLARFTHSLRHSRRPVPVPAPEPELLELLREIVALAKAFRASAKPRRPTAPPLARSVAVENYPAHDSLTRSGLFDAPPVQGMQTGGNLSGDYSTIDMVNRLEPIEYRWIESSPAEQELLGWNLTQLREKSFLDILYPDDQKRCSATFTQALERGEALGLVVRIITAQGKTRSVEVNVGARYGNNQRVSHLRCHLTDVTDKMQAERELRHRTRELTRVNEQLRQINRELEELKDRYTDLYENAPAMYFSLDPEGTVIECNQTMLVTLNRPRDQIVGQPYETLLPEAHWSRFRTRFREFLAAGAGERESSWVKAGGEVIDVWIRGTLIRNSKGAASHARVVAQDVTAKRRLEGELQEKNQRLAETIDELSLKNRELDEFVYVVSHDLQEPLRTLVAFSGFLANDYADRLDIEGQEHLRYLVDASRRMRAMIHGMLNLSRAGKVTGDLAEVDLDDLVTVIKTDLGELLRGSNAELRIRTPLPKIWGDRDRIGQLLANLITNGVRYNESPDRWVEVAATPVADSDSSGALESDLGATVTISIRDNGIGIDPQFHRTIFQLFRRLHTHDEYEGTGVGLAICNKIVQAHSGRIWVESVPGEGATFFITFRTGPAPTTVAGRAALPSGPSSPYGSSASQVVADEHNAV
jgi:PAS domain S-box-containing protein